MPETDSAINLIPGPAPGGAARRRRILAGAWAASEVTLRLSDPATGDTSSQLGITPPTAEDVQIAPAVVQAMAPEADGTRRIQVLLSATSLHAIADSYGVTNIPPWLLGSRGLVYRGQVMPIRSVTVNSFAGDDYLYLLIATE